MVFNAPACRGEEAGQEQRRGRVQAGIDRWYSMVTPYLARIYRVFTPYESRIFTVPFPIKRNGSKNMAKQTGVVKLNGTLQGITFYQLGDKQVARRKTSLDKKRLSTDPAFARSRVAYNALGTGAKAYNVLKHALHPYLLQSADTRQAGRGSAMMAKVVRADNVSAPAEQKIRKEHLHLLKGFEGNKEAALSTVMDLNVSVNIDRSKGEVTIEVPAHSPKGVIASPEGATHYQVVAIAGAADFDSRKTTRNAKEMEWTKLSSKTVAKWKETLSLDAAGDLPVIVGVGIRFAIVEHGKEYMMHNKAFNAFKVVEVFA